MVKESVLIEQTCELYGKKCIYEGNGPGCSRITHDKYFNISLLFYHNLNILEIDEHEFIDVHMREHLSNSLGIPIIGDIRERGTAKA